jgi:hypothetical protein
MCIYEFIKYLRKRIEACNSALKDCYNAGYPCDSDVIRLEEQISVYKDLISELELFN